MGADFLARADGVGEWDPVRERCLKVARCMTEVAPDTPGGVRVRGFCDGGEVRRPLGVDVHKVDAEVPDVAEQLGQLPHGPSASGSSLNYTDMLIVQSRET